MQDSAMMIETRTVPLNFGPLRGADGNARITGPCGDTMEFWVKIDKGKVSFATYTTDGCSHSIICGSAAALLAMGKTPDFVKEFKPEYVLAIARDIPEESAHCALLAVKTLKAAVDDYLLKQCNKDCGSCSKNDCDSRTENPASRQNKSRIPLSNSLEKVRHKIVVLSGKGGVGKSTVATNLAFSFASSGRKVGLLDIDLHGPSIPTMLGIQDERMEVQNGMMIPVESRGLKIISIGFLLQDKGDPLIWRGPMKAKIIEQFIMDVEWGELDFLIVDCPPGTGDEPLSVVQTLGKIDGAVIVTTPQDIAIIDVRKSINFCRELKTPILGIIENFSSFTCPDCGSLVDIFKTGGGVNLAKEMGVNFLGKIPIDAKAVISGDEGRPFVRFFPDSAASKAVMDAFSKIYANLKAS